MNPPDLIPFPGNWEEYEERLNEIFLSKIVDGELTLDGLPIRYRRTPETSNKWACFWHLIQEGAIEEERTPDLRRCERLHWIPWVIKNSSDSSEIDRWENTRGGEKNVLLWFREEYLIVLSRRKNKWLLKTAYCTERSTRIKQLRKERDASKN